MSADASRDQATDELSLVERAQQLIEGGSASARLAEDSGPSAVDDRCIFVRVHTHTCGPKHMRGSTCAMHRWKITEAVLTSASMPF